MEFRRIRFDWKRICIDYFPYKYVCFEAAFTPSMLDDFKRELKRAGFRFHTIRRHNKLYIYARYGNTTYVVKMRIEEDVPLEIVNVSQITVCINGRHIGKTTFFVVEDVREH